MCWPLIKAVSPSERQSADDVTEDDDVTADDDVTVDTRSWSGAHTGKKEPTRVKGKKVQLSSRRVRYHISVTQSL